MTNLHLFYELLFQLLVIPEIGDLFSPIEGFICLDSALDLNAYAKSLPRVFEFTRLDLTENLISARKALSGLSGVYAVICDVTGAIYIGSSANLGVRIRDHIIASTNAHLRNAIDKHGAKNFIFIVIELVEQNPDLDSEENKANLLAREQHWLNWLFALPAQFRYNFSAGQPRGLASG
ncbi:hypothetical protein BC938DRAFT_480577 [Jimgerdemannia flammicorona]|uniref:GIY-YIG domain-containing protein n=1 Tax=Jimgerdemannia flammicorona TaxID=994334 RepID=A0A433QXA3_9FUNG|nr:hypothetical protein BC938DRAFT_480577 [Jimgerdemannia flammicorona]